MSADLQIFDHTDRVPGYPAPTCTLVGSGLASGAFPDGFDLWNVRAEIDAGSELVWERGHGDEALYVVSGAVECDGQVSGPRAAITIDSGVPARIRVTERADLVHCGTWAKEPSAGRPRGPVLQDAHAITMLPEHGVLENRHIDDAGSEIVTTLLADPRRPTGRLDLFRVTGTEARVTRSHSHSEDELIHVVNGTMQVGRDAVTPAMTVAVRGGRRYGFRTLGAFEFINYRADLSTVTMGVGNQPGEEMAARFLASSVVPGDGGTHP